MSLSPAARAVLERLEPRGATAPVDWQALARDIASLDLLDATAVGFSFASAADRFGQRAVLARPEAGWPDGTLSLSLSPDGQQRALLWHDAEADRLRLWLAGREWPLPHGDDGGRLAEPPGTWADDRVFWLPVMAVDHPVQDWSRPSGRGQVQGVFVCDLAAGRSATWLPHDDEIWTAPRLLREGDGWALYADAQAAALKVPARWLTTPTGGSGAAPSPV